MFYSIGLSFLLMSLIGLGAPFTIIGFVEILLITAILNFLLKKINYLIL